MFESAFKFNFSAYVFLYGILSVLTDAYPQHLTTEHQHRRCHVTHSLD